ncbi:DUF4931 domain-containing protein [Candidatus Microgenomates bacterium]|nr:DUF4931 domain-containing protein [Candidatus Microgenomates bacterium]
MARFVPDSKTGRWVIIAPARVDRPHDNVATPDVVGQCVFCPGNEKLNPGELFRVGGLPGDQNWQIRVINNKFPITDLHEVIIHSPDHEKDIDTLPLPQVELILSTYRQRYNYHMANKDGKVLLFNNHDAHAGASIKHPHSQLVVVPGQIHLDVIPREPEQNVVAKTKFFTIYCPDFSQWPYEVWLTPTETKTLFGAITDEEIKDLALLLQKLLAFLVKKFTGSDHDVPYNYYIYHGEDWYLRIIPRLVHRAGFELGTGLSVNIVDPAVAAKEYREGLGLEVNKAN